MKRSLSCCLVAAAMLVPLLRAETKMPLHTGWHLQSACKINAEGPAISAPGFSTAGWISTSVPSTVLAAQVKVLAFVEVVDPVWMLTSVEPVVCP